MMSVRLHIVQLLLFVALYRYFHSDVLTTPPSPHWSETASSMVSVPQITRHYDRKDPLYRKVQCI